MPESQGSEIQGHIQPSIHFTFFQWCLLELSNTVNTGCIVNAPLDNQLPPSATPSPEKRENESLGSDLLTLELEVTELAQKLDVVKGRMCIISDYKLMQPTLKSILSAQNQILNRLSALERVVHCVPH